MIALLEIYHRSRSSEPDRTNRLLLWQRQQGLCDCCSKPIWEPSVETLAQFNRRLLLRTPITAAQPSPEPNAVMDAPPAEEVVTCEICNSYQTGFDYALFKSKVRSGVSPRIAALRIRGDIAPFGAREENQAPETPETRPSQKVHQPQLHQAEIAVAGRAGQSHPESVPNPSWMKAFFPKPGAIATTIGQIIPSVTLLAREMSSSLRMWSNCLH